MRCILSHVAGTSKQVRNKSELQSVYPVSLSGAAWKLQNWICTCKPYFKSPGCFCDSVPVMLVLQNLQCSSCLVNTVTQLKQHVHPFQSKKKARCGRTGREKNPRPVSFHEVKTMWHACLKLFVFILEMLSQTISVSHMPKYCRIYAALLLAEMEMMGVHLQKQFSPILKAPKHGQAPANRKQDILHLLPKKADLLPEQRETTLYYCTSLFHS